MTPLPDWVAKRTATCEHDGCSNHLNPNDSAEAFTDPHTGKTICRSHFKVCEGCLELFYTDDMVKVKDDDNSVLYYCKDCYEKEYTTCPHCKEIVNKYDILPPNERNKWTQKEGGCKKCSEKCDSCARIVDKDYVYNNDGGDYCEDCYSEHYTTCENCSDTIDRESAIYVEGVGEFCPSCYKEQYTDCHKCEKTIEKSEAFEIDGKDYCQKCYEELGPEEYLDETQGFGDFSYTKKDRYLNLLFKLLPISVKELKSKHPSIANGLSDLISFSKGKELTHELVNEYRKILEPEDFPVKYTVWEGAQRSIDEIKNDIVKPQLVLNILASNQMLAKLSAHSALYDLFNNVNNLSKQSGHPFIKDQVGWARLELDPNKEYILVDEIQSDHSNAGFKLKHDIGNQETKKIRNSLKIKYQLNDEELNKLIAEYANILKDFPYIASQAITKFAQKNKFKKIFWHTYESGKKLKENEPPKSLYDKVPKDNFFLPSQNKPFGLDADFFERDAKINHLSKLARKLYLRCFRKY